MKNMRIALMALALAAVLLASLAIAQKSDQAEVLLKAARQKELVDGDLNAAIELYKKIAAQPGATRAIVAKALLQMGQCYEKLGKDGAQKAYERIVREFADQQEPARLARARLAAITGESGPVIRRIWADADDAATSLSPDGTYVSFADWDTTGDLAIREIATGQKRRLTNSATRGQCAGVSAPSPDGKLVAYEWGSSKGGNELRLVRLDASASRLVYRGGDTDRVVPMCWSPDGKRILAVLTSRTENTSRLVLVSVTDGSIRVVKDRAPASQHALFSPDGHYLAYDAQPQQEPRRRDIFALEVEGGRETPLVQHPADDFLLGWTPDGKGLLFASDRYGTRDAWLMPVSGGKPAGVPQLVKKDIVAILPLGFAPDGSYYYRVNIKALEVYTATVDLATGKTLVPPVVVTHRFAGTNASPEWSPDGTRLLYTSRRGSIGPGRNIPTIRTMATGEERDLAPDLRFYNQARWAPDGRSILAFGYGRKRAEEEGIYRIDPETSQTTLLVASGPGEYRLMPQLCPDGKNLLYVYDRPGYQAIMMRNLEAGEEKEVVRDSHGFAWALSPDGRYLAFVSLDTAAKENPLKVMPLQGGEARQLMSVNKNAYVRVSWAPDGRSLILLRRDEPNPGIYRVPIDGGKALRLDLWTNNVQAVRVHPDGRQIAFWEWNSKSELWVMENFLPPPKAAPK